jgi:hypothetical protein
MAYALLCALRRSDQATCGNIRLEFLKIEGLVGVIRGIKIGMASSDSQRVAPRCRRGLRRGGIADSAPSFSKPHIPQAPLPASLGQAYLSLAHHNVFQKEKFDSCSKKCIQCFLRRVDNGLALDVKARIQEHLATGRLAHCA